MWSMEDYNASASAARDALSQHPETNEFIRFATLAANSHNTQPWQFRAGDKRIGIFPDFARRIPVVDPDDHHLFVSLGCAAENLSLAAGACGARGEIAFEPANGGSVYFVPGTGPATDLALFQAIPHRQSTRSVYDGKPVSTADLKLLSSAASVPGVDLILLTGRAEIEWVCELVIAGNSAQLANAKFVEELKSWLRFSPQEAMRSGDGLFTAASVNPILPAWLGPHVFDWSFRAGVENEKYVRQLRSSSGVAVFVSSLNDSEHWCQAGRACQRFALQATALGLKVAFINQPVEVASLRPELARLVGMPGRRPDIVMRFGYGTALPFSSRRPVKSVTI